MSITIRSFETSVVERAFHYWSSKAVDGVPRRRDLRPEEMRSFLPYVFLVDVAEAPMGFRYRLVGSEISRWASREYTGVAVNCREYGPNWRKVFDAYARVVTTGAPEVARYHAPWVGREFLVYERLIAPLSASGTTVDMLFGALCPVGDASPDRLDQPGHGS